MTQFKIFDFLKTVMDRMPLNPEGSRYIMTISDEEAKSLIKDPDMFIFKSNDELIDTISTKIANYYFTNETILHDVKSTLPEHPSSSYGGMGTTICFNHIDLVNNLGIKEFALHYWWDSVIVVYLESVPTYERIEIENFLWSICIDSVINKLSGLTVFDISKQKNDGFSREFIITHAEFVHVNTVNQIRMYAELFEYDKLCLLGSLLDSSIEVPSEFMNMPRETIPSIIELYVLLKKKLYANGLDMYLNNNSKYKIRFQVIQNPDRSITIKPLPVDVENAIKKQLSFWSDYVYASDYNYAFVPQELIPVMEYLKKHNIRLLFGNYVEEIYDYTKSVDIARSIDKEAWDNCFCESIQMFPLPDMRYSEVVQLNDLACIKLSC